MEKNHEIKNTLEYGVNVAETGTSNVNRQRKAEGKARFIFSVFSRYFVRHGLASSVSSSDLVHFLKKSGRA